MAEVKMEIQQVNVPEDCNVIIGQSHFIKTVEDLFEALVTSSPTLEFGIAFCEASGDCLIRHDGNKEDLETMAVGFAGKINAGHTFTIVLRNGYPINVLDRVKSVQEV
ncbi:MAG: adenosine-specific kinase, partial [Synergistaceae bacterium]